MEQKINIDNLDDLQKQALVCMYYAMLPKTDARYKKRMHDWEVLEKRFGTKKTTYKHAKDAFDFYFPNNGRKGWSDDRDLKRRGHAYQEVFELYKDYSADQLEKAVAEIIHGYENEEPTFVSMKCGFPDTVHNILNGNKDITVDGVYTLKEELNIGKHVFVTLGGDTGKSEVDWVPGFIGVAHVIREPYDFGYNGKEKYFKFDIEVDCVFEKPFKREDFLSYREAYDAPYIGPELSRDPSQALSTLDEVDSQNFANRMMAYLTRITTASKLAEKKLEMKSDRGRLIYPKQIKRELGAKIIYDAICPVASNAFYGFNPYEKEDHESMVAEDMGDSYNRCSQIADASIEIEEIIKDLSEAELRDEKVLKVVLKKCIESKSDIKPMANGKSLDMLTDKIMELVKDVYL